MFNGRIGLWDVSRVIDMSDAFHAALLFDGDVARWNVKNVGTMTQIFEQTPGLSPCDKASLSAMRPPYYPFLEERATLEVIEARKWGSPGKYSSKRLASARATRPVHQSTTVT